MVEVTSVCSFLAIEEERNPARNLGVEFETGVDDLMLVAVAKDASALPLMEFALERLWAEQENRRLIRSAYDRMGGLEGALAKLSSSRKHRQEHHGLNPLPANRRGLLQLR
jgi:hypothetical protein